MRLKPIFALLAVFGAHSQNLSFAETPAPDLSAQTAENTSICSGVHITPSLRESYENGFFDHLCENSSEKQRSYLFEANDFAEVRNSIMEALRINDLSIVPFLTIYSLARLAPLNTDLLNEYDRLSQKYPYLPDAINIFFPNNASKSAVLSDEDKIRGLFYIAQISTSQYTVFKTQTRPLFNLGSPRRDAIMFIASEETTAEFADTFFDTDPSLLNPEMLKLVEEIRCFITAHEMGHIHEHDPRMLPLTGEIIADQKALKLCPDSRTFALAWRALDSFSFMWKAYNNVERGLAPQSHFVQVFSSATHATYLALIDDIDPKKASDIYQASYTAISIFDMISKELDAITGELDFSLLSELSNSPISHNFEIFFSIYYKAKTIVLYNETSKNPILKDEDPQAYKLIEGYVAGFEMIFHPDMVEIGEQLATDILALPEAHAHLERFATLAVTSETLAAAQKMREITVLYPESPFAN